MNGPSVLDAEWPSANQPKLASRSDELAVATKCPTVCCAATERMLKPQPMVTAVMSRVGTVRLTTGNHAPRTIIATPSRITRPAPTRSTQRPIDSDVNTGMIEKSAMNTPTKYSAPVVLRM